MSNDVDNPPSHDMQPTEQEMVAKDAKGKCFVRYNIIISYHSCLAFFRMEIFDIHYQS